MAILPIVLIVELFVSLQGEGVLAGTPSFFIRTSGCNLRCAWCDTPYASWKPEGQLRSVDEVAAAARQAGVRHVVVTGGEPLLQREIGPLTAALAQQGHHLTVETAGTVAPAFTCDLLSVSPKTSNSTPPGPWRRRHEQRRLDRAPLQALLAAHREYQLKFVVQDAGDLPEIEALVGELGAARERVLLMPEGRSAVEVAARAPAVAALCLRHGFRYSPRLQLDLFGGGRGV
ncbi:MAG: 7-carboxy-7-deazaguanine synthase QueE [Acidobacteriota bacterium]|jgi:7-carboxy-7-deazaguanine synthase